MASGNIPLWNKASNENLAQSMECVDVKLCTIRTLKTCNCESCDEQDHCKLIDKYYDKIISCMQSASYLTIPQRAV